MRRIESIEDGLNGVVTYELADGSKVRLDAHAIRESGPAELIRHTGKGGLLPTKRAPVIQRGQRIGTVAPDFDPMFIKSKSYFYEPRHGDFTRDGECWVAKDILGPGDLEAIPGFRFGIE